MEGKLFFKYKDDNDNAELLFEKADKFTELMMEYRCAVREIETKLHVLNDEYSTQFDRNPFESIKARIKTPKSIFEKLRRRSLELSVESIEENLADVAGVRVICSFVDDIYRLAEQLIAQDDIVLIEKKDYIKNPKSNGYRSLHLILEIPIFLSKGKKYIKVEVQFRTIAMDFWASLDHKIQYKFPVEIPDEIKSEMYNCSIDIKDLDNKMNEIKKAVNKYIDE